MLKKTENLDGVDSQQSPKAKLQVNFKHVLSVVFQNATRILFPISKSTVPSFLKKIIAGIVVIKQKVRAGRSYVRRRKSPLFGFRNNRTSGKSALKQGTS